MMNKPKYTKNDLEQNSKQYEKLINKLCTVAATSYNSPLHNKLLKEENRLHQKDLDIRRSLNICMSTICPILRPNSCDTCTGTFERLPKHSSRMQRGKRNIMVPVNKFGQKNIYRCNYKISFKEENKQIALREKNNATMQEVY